MTYSVIQTVPNVGLVTHVECKPWAVIWRFIPDSGPVLVEGRYRSEQMAQKAIEGFKARDLKMGRYLTPKMSR